MKETKTYNVIWIDDKHDEIDLVGNAEQDNIIITPFKYGKDGISKLKETIDLWDGVIVDVKCLWASDNEVDRVESFHMIRDELIMLKSKRLIPIFVYSGQPDVLSDESFKKSLNGQKLYRKNLDEEELLADIKVEADKLIEVQIRHKYLSFIGGLPSDIAMELTGILSYIENNITNESGVFTKMRKIIEWIMIQLNDYGLLAVVFNGANINACSVYLGKKELEKYVPLHIQRSFHSCVEICNNGSHRLEIDEIVKHDQAPFLIRSTTFELLNILRWYCDLPRDGEYINEMKAYIATAPPDDKIVEGVLEKDERGNYHCGIYLVSYGSISKAGLKVGDWIRITYSIDNSKSPADIRAKYPRFAKELEKQQ